MLLMTGDRLLLALDVLAVIDSRHGNRKTRNRRGLNEQKVVTWVTGLLGPRLSYFSPWLLYDIFFHIRLLLQAPHHEPSLPWMRFNILPVLQHVNGSIDDPWLENYCKYFQAFEERDITEDDLKD
ncbi:MAG: hypothetical protein M1275_03495 [Patescibacteria group bacterium]|nr:hypothetical protein [Patescibacteria group bacterium]